VNPGSTVKTVRKIGLDIDINYMTVYKTILKLEEMGKVVTTKKGCHNVYTIKNWELFQSDEERGTESGNKKVTKRSQEGNKKVTYIKREKGKKGKRENKKPLGDFFQKWPEMNQSQRAVEALQYYYELFNLRKGYKPEVSFGGKDKAIANKLVSGRTAEDVKYIVEQYLELKDDFIKKAGWSFNLVPSRVNAILASKTPQISFCEAMVDNGREN
jgi:DNA-binding transcriptional regulator YhcF (GntR family)